ncbi:hypothetical protein U91I_02838 [alpha proteobacterium U9-1i]|nr:hypothetical protein U91I_02838 [alpha proteobacterium U9-1i]
MERFVFVTAVTVAIIFGVFAMFGGVHWNMDWDEADAHGVAPVVALAAGRAEPQTYAGSEVRLRHVAAFISVVPEDRTDVSVEIDNPGGAPMPAISLDEEDVVVDGQLRGRIENCRDDGVELRGYGFVANDQLPRITIRTPRTLVIGVSGAGRTEIGETQALDADFSGCGTATLAAVAGDLRVELSGSGEVRGAGAQTLDAEIAGSGEIEVGPVANGADVSIAGSGSVAINGLTGPLESSGAGSGSIEVRGGSITTATVDLAGSGDVTISAPVQRLEASIVGSGDVDVNAAVGEVDAEIAGSGNVTVQSVTGNVRKQIMGSGDVTVGG